VFYAVPTKSGFYLVQSDAVMILVTSCMKTVHCVGAGVLSKTFGRTTWQEVAEQFMLKELRNLYSSEHVPCMEEVRNAHRILIGKPEGRKPLIKPRCRGTWDRGGVVWVYLAQNRYRWWGLVNSVMNLRVP
jgi:hypothetical protein